MFDFADALSQLCSNFPESLLEEKSKFHGCDGPATNQRIRMIEEFADYYQDSEEMSENTAQKQLL